MGLPNIGPLELVIVLAIALLVIGPRRLPEMGEAVGRTIREFRKASSGLSDRDQPESQVIAPAEEHRDPVEQSSATVGPDGVPGSSDTSERS